MPMVMIVCSLSCLKPTPMADEAIEYRNVDEQIATVLTLGAKHKELRPGYQWGAWAVARMLRDGTAIPSLRSDRKPYRSFNHDQ